MLAPNYMTAKDLQVSKELHSALIKVLGMFERGEMQHVKYSECGFLPDTPDKHGFNLAVGMYHTSCGAVGCFAGWASMFMKCDVTDVFSNVPTRNLARLFYGFSSLLWGKDDKHFSLNDVNIEQATHALRNYLTTGDPQWSDVLQ